MFTVTDRKISEKLKRWINENIFPTYDYMSGDTYLFNTSEILEHIDEDVIAGFGTVNLTDIDILMSADYIELED